MGLLDVVGREWVCARCGGIKKAVSPGACPACGEPAPGWSALRDGGVCPRCNTWASGRDFLRSGCPGCGFRVASGRQLNDLWAGRL